MRSLAKETLGSTRTGRAIRLVAVRWSKGWIDMVECQVMDLNLDPTTPSIKETPNHGTHVCAPRFHSR